MPFHITDIYPQCCKRKNDRGFTKQHFKYPIFDTIIYSIRLLCTLVFTEIRRQAFFTSFIMKIWLPP